MFLLFIVSYSLFLFLFSLVRFPLFIFYASFVCYECGWRVISMLSIFLFSSSWKSFLFDAKLKSFIISSWYFKHTVILCCCYCYFRLEWRKTSNVVFKHEVKQMWTLNAMIRPIQKKSKKPTHIGENWNRKSKWFLNNIGIEILLELEVIKARKEE